MKEFICPDCHEKSAKYQCGTCLKDWCYDCFNKYHHEHNLRHIKFCILNDEWIERLYNAVKDE